ncbi:MAG: SWIM zinc finger family protein [Chloroflexi bacterium]|nr:SWIM zinc finger family protein [Chloroflexota bacterium]
MMTQLELARRARERARTQRIRVFRVAGTERDEYVSRSRGAEPGAYWRLWVEDEIVHCSCPGYTYRQSCKHAAALELRRERARLRGAREVAARRRAA